VISERNAIRHFYGLDLPWYQQYGNYLNRLLHFDLGYSWSDRTLKVWDMLRIFAPTSAALGLSSIAFALFLGVPLGMVAALRSNSRYDTLIQMVALALFAAPTYVLVPFFQLAMVWLTNHDLPHLAVAGWGTWDAEIAPVTITGLASFAFFLRFTRTSVIEVMRQDYVRTARAKGLSERAVLWRHVFRNALMPLITILALAVGFVVTGLFITEQLFNIPGIGAESLKAIIERDFSVAQGVGILLAASSAFMNMAADVVYGLVDPRIRVS
jgi:ABC-type dipeptide/oligopeptide/nickel transport system permease component